MMNFTDYQTKSRATAKYPVIGHGVIYPTLGLVNEAGGVAGERKKRVRGKGGGGRAAAGRAHAARASIRNDAARFMGFTPPPVRAWPPP